MWLYVKDYGSQFKTKTDLRMIMYEEFKRYDIRIPWPIRTVYQGDEKKEQIEIDEKDEFRNKVIDEYGLGDLGRRRRRIRKNFSKLKNPYLSYFLLSQISVISGITSDDIAKNCKENKGKFSKIRN